MEGITATDQEDGNIIDEIIFEENVDCNIANEVDLDDNSIKTAANVKVYDKKTGSLTDEIVNIDNINGYTNIIGDYTITFSVKNDIKANRSIKASVMVYEENFLKKQNNQVVFSNSTIEDKLATEQDRFTSFKFSLEEVSKLNRKPIEKEKVNKINNVVVKENDQYYKYRFRYF